MRRTARAAAHGAGSRKGAASQASGASSEAAERLRLDKWLWRARFFKTRGVAAEAVEGGKVRVNSARVLKPGYGVKVGDVLTFARAGRIFVVEILALGARRGPASEAQSLYREAPSKPLTSGTGAETPPSDAADAPDGRDAPAPSRLDAGERPA